MILFVLFLCSSGPELEEIEENNRMGKTRELFKKTGDIKGIFQVKMGSIKDRTGIDLTEAEDIKKRWQEYTEDLYKKDLHDPDNHDGVITHTHLEPDILECEVKWAFGSIVMNKASGGDGIPVAATAAAKSLQLCPTLCDPIGSPIPGILQARTLEWVAISFSNA